MYNGSVVVCNGTVIMNKSPVIVVLMEADDSAAVHLSHTQTSD
jgi:hypothetical protein